VSVNWQELVDELKPWHYCHQFPNDVVTGTSIPDWNEKLDVLTAAGAWPKPEYPRVLDLGANSGLFSMWFADNKRSVVDAVEYGNKEPQFAKAYQQLCLATFAKGYEDAVMPLHKNIIEGDYGTDEYDLIIFLGVLHHLAAPYHNVVFTSCLDALKPGASIVVQTKPEMMVPQKLRTAGFENISQLPNYRQQERLAWTANKPKKS